MQKEHGGEPRSLCWCSNLPQALIVLQRGALIVYAPAIFLSCGGRDSASAEAAKGLSDRPLETFGSPLIGWYRDQALAGRGGSVSRRDHDQAYRRHVQLTGGTN